jgi:hypothetical protein
MAYSRAGREMTGQESTGEASPGQGQAMATRLAREVAQSLRYSMARPAQSASLSRHWLLFCCFAWAAFFAAQQTQQTHHCSTVPRVSCGDGYRHVGGGIDRLCPVPESSLVGHSSVVFPV